LVTRRRMCDKVSVVQMASGRQKCLRRAAVVAVVKSADLWDHDDRS
jgi:hypothetical protein